MGDYADERAIMMGIDTEVPNDEPTNEYIIAKRQNDIFAIRLTPNTGCNELIKKEIFKVLKKHQVEVEELPVRYLTGEICYDTECHTEDATAYLKEMIAARLGCSANKAGLVGYVNSFEVLTTPSMRRLTGRMVIVDTRRKDNGNK